MKKITGLVVSLTVISAVCSGVLSYINEITRDPIAAVAGEKKKNAVRQVMPASVVSIKAVSWKDESRNDPTCFVGEDSSGKTVGYAGIGSDPNGYGGVIELMVGFDASFGIVSYKALQATETPGLGTKLSSPEFMSQFSGKQADKSLLVTKDGGKIEAITSATITSRAVCAAVVDAAAKIKAAVEKH